MGKQLKSGDQLGNYELIKSLGQGGMAEVFLAKHRGIGGFQRLVALKVIHASHSEDPEFVESLVDEAKLAVQLNHSNVGQVFDLGKVGPIYFIVMEFIDGKDLYRVLFESSQQNKQIPLGVALYIAEKVALGLGYCHDRPDHYGRPMNLVHRDVSPQNVFLSWTGEVKLLDFGIAKVNSRLRHTEAGVIKGKLQYMSPEQISGDAVDPRSDLFSCGICLYEMLAGEMAYHETDSLQLLEKIRSAELKPILKLRPNLDASVLDLLDRALHRDPNQRFQDGESLGQAMALARAQLCPDFRPTELGRFLTSLFEETPFFLDASVSSEVSRVTNEETELSGSISSSIIFGDDKTELPSESSVLDEVVDETVNTNGDFGGGSQTQVLNEVDDAEDESNYGHSSESSSMGQVTRLFDAPASRQATPFEDPSTNSNYQVFSAGAKPKQIPDDVRGRSNPTKEEFEIEAQEEQKSQVSRRLRPNSKPSKSLYSETPISTEEGQVPAETPASEAIEQDHSNPFDASTLTQQNETQKKQSIFLRLFNSKPSRGNKNTRSASKVALVIIGFLTLYLMFYLFPQFGEPKASGSVDLVIKSVPAGARVYINMQDIGAVTNTVVKIAELKDTQILLTLEGYQPTELVIDRDQLEQVGAKGSLERRIVLRPH